MPESPDAGAAASPGATLSPRVRAFLDEPNFASLATLDPDGRPRQAVIWFRREGDLILVNSRADRRWPRNLRRDGRVSLAVFDRADQLLWVGITGEVVEIDDDPVRALHDIQQLDARYNPTKPEPGTQFIGQQRVTFRIRIDAVHEHLD